MRNYKFILILTIKSDIYTLDILLNDESFETLKEFYKLRKMFKSRPKISKRFKYLDNFLCYIYHEFYFF